MKPRVCFSYMPSLREQGKTTVSGTYTHHWNSECYFFSNCVYVVRLKRYFSVQKLFILSLRLLKCARFEVLTAVLKIHIYIAEIIYGVRTFALIQKMRDRTTESCWLTPVVVCNISFLASHPTYWYRRSIIEGANMALVRTVLLSSISERATLTEL